MQHQWAVALLLQIRIAVCDAKAYSARMSLWTLMLVRSLHWTLYKSSLHTILQVWHASNILCRELHLRCTSGILQTVHARGAHSCRWHICYDFKPVCGIRSQVRVFKCMSWRWFRSNMAFYGLILHACCLLPLVRVSTEFNAAVVALELMALLVAWSIA